MGACTSDKYKLLREEYGLELTKMVIGEKNKLFIDRIVGRLKREISETARKTEGSANVAIQETRNKIKEFYAKVKDELDQRQPGGVKSLQQMSGHTAQQLLGYNFIVRSLDGLSESVEERVKEEQNQLIGQLMEIKQAQEELFNAERTAIPPYHQMQPDEREGVLKRGEMEFHDLVVKYEEFILSRYGHKLEPEYYANRFNTIDPHESLNALLFVARDKFVTSLNLILAQKLDSYILFDQS